MTSPSVFQCRLKMHEQFQKRYWNLSVASNSPLRESSACADTNSIFTVLCQQKSAWLVCRCTTLHTCKRCTHSTECHPSSSSFSPSPPRVSLTSQPAARGQTCISLHSPLALSFFFIFYYSLFFSSHSSPLLFNLLL